MEKKAFIAKDLGPGDGGKGGTVHKICVATRAHTVIKEGGAQGNHGVRTAAGESFCFSQFGCGTFEGAHTHISPLFVLEPYRLLHEGDRLRNEWRIDNIFEMMTIDKTALCATPYHTTASRLRELYRKKNPKGTVGVGIGEAVRDAEEAPELAIHAGDLAKPHLYEKLEAIRARKRAELAPILDDLGSLPPEDRQAAKQEIELLEDDEFSLRIVSHYLRLRSLVKIVDPDYLATEILSKDGTVVIESSHGILTDRLFGFSPHTSWLRTLPDRSIGLLQNCGYDGRIVKLGVTRAYQFRHGAGPLVTHEPSLVEKLLPGSTKDDNRWQGKPRAGMLDFVSLRYSIDVCGGPEFFDGIAVTWFDQISDWGLWKFCDGYENADDPEFFEAPSRIKVQRHSDHWEQLAHQRRLTERLNNCRPGRTFSVDVRDVGQRDLCDLCASTFEERLKVPIKMISFGPTENDRVLL